MENSDIWKIIDKYFEDNPQSLVRHHVESYNDFFKKGIFQIFKEKNPIQINTRFDEKLDDYRSKCIMYLGGRNGDKIYFGKPIIYDETNTRFFSKLPILTSNRMNVPNWNYYLLSFLYIVVF